MLVCGVVTYRHKVMFSKLNSLYTKFQLIEGQENLNRPTNF